MRGHSSRKACGYLRSGIGLFRVAFYLHAKIAFRSIDRPPLPFKGLSGTYEKVNLDSKTIIVTLKYGTLGFVSGSTVEIYFHTETGMSYLISATLP